jgi:hypothetical protein
MYCPPVAGIIAPISASTIMLNKLNTPAIIHTRNISEGEPSNPAISAGRIKMPDPITLPITMEIAVDRPMVR